jgi:hypothetical protein
MVALSWPTRDYRLLKVVHASSCACAQGLRQTQAYVPVTVKVRYRKNCHRDGGRRENLSDWNVTVLGGCTAAAAGLPIPPSRSRA